MGDNKLWDIISKLMEEKEELKYRLDNIIKERDKLYKENIKLQLEIQQKEINK